MSVLFCDTDCELWYTTARELDLKVIGMPYTLDGVERLYDLGENTDFKGFFRRMKEGSVPITSGLNSQNYTEIFEPYFAAGEDILYVAFSSKMSGTFVHMQVAVDALQKKYPTVKFRRFDTLNISMGAGIMVYLAAKRFGTNGGEIDDTYDYLESIVGKIAVFFVVDDLKYLSRGGRLSPTAAKVGSIIQLKPILTVNDAGEIAVYAKQQGSKKAMAFTVAEFAKKYVDIDNAPITIVGADNDEAVETLKKEISSIKPNAEIWIQPVGPVIGAHCGPGTYGLIFTSVSR